MANIRVDINGTIKDGSEIVFRSPVDCSAITGLVVYYTAEDGTAASKEFVLADAHGHNVGDIDHLFAENVVVKVILDVTAGMAYVQNADTNAYIERTFVKTVGGVAPDDSGNVALPDGQDGVTYVPSVEDGWLSWENNGGLPNPEPIYIIGQDGKDGADGKDGQDGYTPVKGKDYFDGKDGNPGKDGTDGKSAYAYALDGGYTGTEEEFAQKLASESGGLPLPAVAAVGQFIAVSAVNENGKVTATEANDDVTVKYTPQNFTPEQKAQILENIGAAKEVKPRVKAEITVTTQDNALLNKNNRVETLNGCWCRYTNEIPVSEGDRFSVVFASVASDGHPNILWLDADKTVISTEIHNISVGCLLVTVPPGVTYVRFADSGYGTIASLTENIKLRFEILHMAREDEEREIDIVGKTGGYYGWMNTWSSVDYMSSKRSNPIPTYDGDTFYFTGGNGVSEAIWYDSNGAVLSRTNGTGSQLSLIPPIGAVLVRFISYSYNTDLTTCLLNVAYKSEDKTLEYLQGMNYLWGKKYVACGDSFTAGDFATKTEETWDEATQEYKTYCWHIANRNRMNLVNEARSGTTMYNNGNEYAFSVNRYKQIPTDADYITICFGLNETTAPIGTLEDATNATVIGAWNVVLEYLITNMPYAKIGIIIPDAWCSAAMREALIDVAEYWGIPYLDLTGDPRIPLLINGRRSGPTLSAKAIELRTAAFAISAEDTHPNPKGHAYRSTIIENFMRSL